jgi:hypothetical protein
MNITDTLLPLRESSMVYIPNIDHIPSIDDAMYELASMVANERLEDHVANFGDLIMDEDGFIDFKGTKYCYNRHSLSQMVERIKPPGVSMAPYIAACPPQLRALNYRYWHAQKDWSDKKTPGSAVQVRTAMGGIPLIRAVVSNIYSPVDDVFVMDHIRESLMELNAIDVIAKTKMASYRGDEVSRYVIYWKNDKQVLLGGDDLYGALAVKNSEVGASSLRINAMIHVLNLDATYAIPSSMKEIAIRHVGDGLSKISRAVKKSLEFIGPFVQRLSQAYSDLWHDVFPNVDIERVLTAIGRLYKLPAKIMASAQRELGAGASRAHVAAAIVRAARVEGLDVADMAHEAAGNLIVHGWGPVSGELARMDEEDKRIDA